MKKSSLLSLIALLNGNTIDNADEIKAELEKEVNRGAEKAEANRTLYNEAKTVVLNALEETPVTISELFDAVESELPAGFSKGKLQYAITRLWTNDVVRIEGKINTYRKA